MNFVTFSANPLDELGQSLPLRRIHMRVVSIGDVFLVDDVRVDSFGAESSLHQLENGFTKFSEEAPTGTL